MADTAMDVLSAAPSTDSASRKNKGLLEYKPSVAQRIDFSRFVLC